MVQIKIWFAMIIGISGYVGNRLTGIGRVLINILSELAKQYPEDKYVLFRNFDFKEYDNLTQYQNIEIVDVPYTKESGLKNILWHQWLFQKLLKKYKCDIAYIPNFTLLLWKTIPTIVTIHDLIEYNVPDKFSKARMFYRKQVCDPLMAKKSNHILTVSKSSYKDIISYLGVKPSKLTLTLNATDRNVFKKYSKEKIIPAIKKYNLEYKKYLLFVGTIDFPGKNIKTIIEAFFNLRSKNELNGIKLVIIGKNGFNSKVIYDFVNASPFKDEVIFTGYLNDDDLPKYYAGATIMLYLSLFEGFGLPVLEAMSCATPVICSNTSCFPEIVEELDVKVPPTDVNAVEEKILKILSNTIYYEILSQRCYEKSLKYSWTESARVYHNVFEQILKGKIG
ncbi:glycosyltransferase family 4 protein [Paraprevotella clara]|uniref:glycosyltransferase family 4 protein n=3 Tax=Paraprevotella clara TaxID=454154 RepID=UPI00241D00E0|nr:glycosyltransferase family 1 protein [Paraprevotella clara]